MNKIWCLGLSLALGLGSAQAARQMEWLNRGLVAVKTTNGVFLSWRVLGTDGNTTGFNLYRDGEKIASFTGSQASNYTDTKGTASSKYSVKAMVGGKEMAADAAVSVWSNQYLTVNLDRPNGGSDYTYSPNDIAVGDVDGDGEFELILKWDPSNSQDNSKSGYTDNVFIDCYRLTGERLWRIDLGRNIRAGQHYTQFLVADFDLDGKAEMTCKTADGTVDGTGKVIGNIYCGSRDFAAKEVGISAPCAFLLMASRRTRRTSTNFYRFLGHCAPSNFSLPSTHDTALRASSIDLVIMRGMWNGPLKRLPFAGWATVPSRCRYPYHSPYFLSGIRAYVHSRAF